MESLRELVNDSLDEIKARKEDKEREAFLEALDAYSQTVKDGLIRCCYQYVFKDEYVRIEYNGLTAASAFKADLYTKSNTSTMLNIIGTDSQLASRYRKSQMLLEALEEYRLDDLEDAVGEKLQELEEKVNETSKAYVDSRGDGNHAVKSTLERILNRLTHSGNASVKFYDINIAYPDDEDIITQACDIKIDTGERSYVFKYVVPLLSKPFFDDSITVFCATNGLSNMTTTMKNLYTLKCCLEMAQNHAEILGVDGGRWFISCCSDILDFYYKDNELMERFMAKVYLRRPDNTKTYHFTNS